MLKSIKLLSVALTLLSFPGAVTAASLGLELASGPVSSMHNIKEQFSHPLKPNVHDGGYYGGDSGLITSSFDFAIHIIWYTQPDPDGLDTFAITVSGTKGDGTPVTEMPVCSMDLRSQPYPHPQYWRMNFRIDSTYFKHNTPLTIHATCSAPHSAMSQSWWTLKVYNRAYLIGNLRVDPAAQGVIDSATLPLLYMNHHVVSKTRDIKNTILQSLPLNTVFIACTHGNFESFGDCLALSGIGGYIYSKGEVKSQPDEIAEAMSHQRALSQPPYNFVFLEVCWSAGSVVGDVGRVQPIAANYPTSFWGAVPGPNSNQAFLGWQYEVYINPSNVGFVADLMANLAHGMTLSASVHRASQTSPVFGVVNNFWYQHFQMSMGHVMPLIMGDKYMKLHGVYGGSDGHQWKLILENAPE